MKYLLDTNIISELYKKKPHGAVMAWLRKQDASALYLSAITIGEIRRGIELKRKGYSEYPESLNDLAASLMHMELSFANRILPFDQNTAHIWATITIYYPDKILDTQIAAIALANDAILVTRDKDFNDLASRIAHLGIGLHLLNPFNNIS